MKATDKIIQELYEKSPTFKGFFKRNITGILTTIIFHLLVFIILMGIKISSFKGINELGVVLDFAFQEEMKEKEQLSPEEIKHLELLERFLERSLRTTNQGVNISEQLEKQISTRNFVEQVVQELEEKKSEEEKNELKKFEQQLLHKEIHEESDKSISQENKEFYGPTNITYEFFEIPFNRLSVYLPVPIYKCQGEGVVEVEIQVDRSGRVVSAKPIIIGNPPDGDCLAKAAIKYASLTQFSKPYDAPPIQKGKITYSFVAQ